MNKQQLVDHVAQEIRTYGYVDITKKVIKMIVEQAFRAVIDGAKKDGKTSIPSLGTFKLKQQAPRVSRNPLTGVPVDVPAKCTMSFKPAAKIKEELTRDCLG